MRVISYEVLIRALHEKGVDAVYEVLERIFMEEPIIIVNANGEVVFRAYEVEELWDYLEKILENIGQSI